MPWGDLARLVLPRAARRPLESAEHDQGSFGSPRTTDSPIACVTTTDHCKRSQRTLLTRAQLPHTLDNRNWFHRGAVFDSGVMRAALLIVLANLGRWRDTVLGSARDGEVSLVRRRELTGIVNGVRR